MYWHESLMVGVKDKVDCYIDVLDCTSDSDPLWRSTCVYVAPGVKDSHLTWPKMLDLSTSRPHQGQNRIGGLFRYLGTMFSNRFGLFRSSLYI